MSADEPEPDYHSKLTRAEFEAIVAIEAVMAKGCEGMFPNDGGKRRRTEFGMSQQKLANAAYLSGSNICYYETGHHAPGLDSLAGRGRPRDPLRVGTRPGGAARRARSRGRHRGQPQIVCRRSERPLPARARAQTSRGTRAMVTKDGGEP